MTWFGLGAQVDARISRYIDNVVTGGGGVAAHASTHVRAGTDEIDGDKLDIDWNPSTYVPDLSPPEVTSINELTAHLTGIDNALAESRTFAWVTGESGQFTITDTYTQLDFTTIQESGGGTFLVTAGELTPPDDGTYVLEGSARWDADSADGSDTVELRYQVFNDGTGLWETITGH